MHLEKVSRVNFYGELRQIEESITPNYILVLEKEWSLILIFELFFLGPIVYLLGANPELAIIIVVLALVITAYKAARYFGKQLYLPTSAQEFYKLNETEMNIIDSEVGVFNSALSNQKNGQLLLSSGDQQNDEDLANYWEKRRKSLQQKVNAFVARFREAVNDDLQRKQEQRRKNPRLLKRAYKEKVRQLKQLEASLGAPPENLQECCKDHAPYSAANKLREQLAQEKQELEKLELKKSFPKAQLLLRKANK